MFKKLKTSLLSLIALAGFAFAQVVHAADSPLVAAATAETTGQKTDLQAIGVLLIGLTVVLWGIFKLIGMFRSR